MCFQMGNHAVCDVSVPFQVSSGLHNTSCCNKTKHSYVQQCSTTEVHGRLIWGFRSLWLTSFPPYKTSDGPGSHCLMAWLSSRALFLQAEIEKRGYERNACFWAPLVWQGHTFPLPLMSHLYAEAPPPCNGTGKGIPGWSCPTDSRSQVAISASRQEPIPSTVVQLTEKFWSYQILIPSNPSLDPFPSSFLWPFLGTWLPQACCYPWATTVCPQN